MKRAAHGLICLAVIVSMQSAFASDAIELVDQTGATVRIAQPIDRLASVYGPGTYYVYALGAAERLVAGWFIGMKGIAHASAAMFRFEPRLDTILSFGEPNVEEMVARGVQLILADGSRHAAFSEQMTELGVPVIQYQVETPDALMEAVLLTGRALGPGPLERAHAFVEDYERVLAGVAAAVEHVTPGDRVRVLFLGTDRLQVTSGEMYQTRLIEAAGGISVTAGLLGYWNEVNLEQILLWNPEVILIPPYGPVRPDDLLEDPDWGAIDAVRTGRVHRMPRVIAPMDTPVPESLLGIVWMANLLYPNAVDLDLAAEVEHFYTVYYGFELTEAEREHLSGQ